MKTTQDLLADIRALEEALAAADACIQALAECALPVLVETGRNDTIKEFSNIRKQYDCMPK